MQHVLWPWKGTGVPIFLTWQHVSASSIAACWRQVTCMQISTGPPPRVYEINKNPINQLGFEQYVQILRIVKGKWRKHRYETNTATLSNSPISTVTQLSWPTSTATPSGSLVSQPPPPLHLPRGLDSEPMVLVPTVVVQPHTLLRLRRCQIWWQRSLQPVPGSSTITPTLLDSFVAPPVQALARYYIYDP